MSYSHAQPAPGRTAVISDTHFGEAGALLASPDHLERLIAQLAGSAEDDDTGAPVKQLVLLGDVWDLWRTDLSTAVRASRPFFEVLSGLPGLCSLVLVFGNHDYHLYFNLAESRALREAGEAGEAGRVEKAGAAGILDPLLEEDAGHLRDILGVPDGIEFTVKYPFHLLDWHGRTVMLTHGHQVDFFARRFWWAKTSWLARAALKRVSGVSASDLELYNAPFYEALYLFGRIPEFSERISGWYRYLQQAARLMGISTPGRASYRRFTSVDDNSREIAAMLSSLYPGHLPDVFVFGHTHRAGSGRIAAGLYHMDVYNTGSWLEEEGATPATWLELGADGVIRGLSLRR